MDDLSATITRLRKELNDARKTRDKILNLGASQSFGGNSFAQVNLSALLPYIRGLERDLYKAESLAAGLDVDPDTRVSVVSQY